MIINSFSSVTLQAIPLIHRHASFRLSRFSGALHSIPASKLISGGSYPCNITPKVKQALEFCDDPYRFDPAASRLSTISNTQGCDDPSHAIHLANQMIKACRLHFWLARMHACMRKPLFENSSDAVAFFRKEVKGDQTALCLPRAFFAAKTSKKFKDEGVVFIGVFLPARSMHAWVVESGALADPHDDIWINYQPVAALA